MQLETETSDLFRLNIKIGHPHIKILHHRVDFQTPGSVFTLCGCSLKPWSPPRFCFASLFSNRTMLEGHLCRSGVEIRKKLCYSSTGRIGTPSRCFRLFFNKPCTPLPSQITPKPACLAEEAKKKLFLRYSEQVPGMRHFYTSPSLTHKHDQIFTQALQDATHSPSCLSQLTTGVTKSRIR